VVLRLGAGGEWLSPRRREKEKKASPKGVVFAAAASFFPPLRSPPVLYYSASRLSSRMRADMVSLWGIELEGEKKVLGSERATKRSASEKR
jgi:hypothetical protein